MEPRWGPPHRRSRSLGGDHKSLSLCGDWKSLSLGGDRRSRSLGGDHKSLSLCGDQRSLEVLRDDPAEGMKRFVLNIDLICSYNDPIGNKEPNE